jgi:hypothetical protein
MDPAPFGRNESNRGAVSGRPLDEGFTADFLPTKGHFHITLEEQGAGAKPVAVHVPDLKPSSS